MHCLESGAMQTIIARETIPCFWGELLFFEKNKQNILICYQYYQPYLTNQSQAKIKTNGSKQVFSIYIFWVWICLQRLT